MNLGRAKLILIIAFAGLNIFLGYQLFWPDFGRLANVAVTSEELEATERMLEDNNYILDASFDRSPQTSDFLTVSPDQNFRQKLLYQFIKSGAAVEETDDATYYRLDEKTAVVHLSGLIQVFYNKGVFLAEDSVNLEENELKSQVEEYLQDNALMPEELMFDYLEKNEDDFILLNYYQALGKTPIFAGQLKVVIESDHIKAIEVYSLQPVERVLHREMEVISPTEALSNLVTELGASTDKRVIKKIDLGYFSGEYDAEKWDIPPVWRIVLDGYQKYYINAFTGNLEKDTVIPEQLQEH